VVGERPRDGERLGAGAQRADDWLVLLAPPADAAHDHAAFQVDHGKDVHGRASRGG
jgi:hypothetical protein